jgi:hypothetical protein
MKIAFPGEKNIYSEVFVMKKKSLFFCINCLVVILGLTLAGCAGLSSGYGQQSGVPVQNRIVDPNEAPDQGVSGPYNNGWWGPNIYDTRKIVNVSFDDIEKVATFVIGGMGTDFSKAEFAWAYTAQLDKLYSYEFEAWTDSGTMTVNLWHREEQLKPVTVTMEHQIFKVESSVFPAVTNDGLFFQFGDQTGNMNIRMISIKVIK